MNRLEISNPSGHAASVTIDDHQVMAESLNLYMDARDIPSVMICLPVTDGVIACLDADIKLSKETRSALVAMGWQPPLEIGELE